MLNSETTSLTQNLANPVELKIKNLNCIECHSDFVFSAGEQNFFLSRGLSNEPKRCPHCRVLMRMRREGKPTDIVTKVNCANCGENTTVPFLPKDDKKIFCAACLKSQNFRKETENHMAISA